MHHRSLGASALFILLTGLVAAPGAAQGAPLPRVANLATLTGLIRDDANLPLAGAVVLVVGAKVGTVTDANGQYILLVSGTADSLRVSAPGFKESTAAFPALPRGKTTQMGTRLKRVDAPATVKTSGQDE